MLILLGLNGCPNPQSRRQLLEKQAVSVIEPDTSKSGGIMETKRVAAMADLQYVPVAPHNTSTPLGTLAGAH
jgi:L-alanine-DL-glutamate epimerase-like enolase superfamily enzyme